MEATSPASSNENKRKSLVTAEHERTKRLKTGQECDQVPLDVHPTRSPRISVLLEHLKQPVTLNELTELLHYAALGKSVKKPSWCRFHKQRKVQGVNVVIVQDVTQSHFYKHYLSLPNLRKNYTTIITVIKNSCSYVYMLFTATALKKHPVIIKFGTERRGLTAYVLSQEEMIKNNYPVKGLPGCEEFVCTDSADFVTDSSPLYGLDCEMCLTAKGNELSRVSLVDSSGKCLLDELVKPPNRILNYLTKFSGITAEMLRPIKMTLRDVQQKLRDLLPRDAVLVGHSLHCDLRALKMIHRHVIDTSLLYRKEFGQKFKLKILAETLLKRQIQTEEKIGHNPTEDAVAALELAQYFIKTGPCKVTHCLINTHAHTHRVDTNPFVCSMLGCGESSGGAFDGVFSLRVCVFFPQMFSSLRDMCVVFAGPFPPGFSEKDVRRLFGCCGPVHKVKVLNTTVRVCISHTSLSFSINISAAIFVNERGYM
uniref:Exonuclease domain-containing protein n=1 Tax=Sphaeramia orbicularis TaxID=375764 RepID=A0A672YIQ4_9TELE